MKIAIIGAGFSGCYLYNKLIKKGHNITIFEKSRGTGGRLSTKYLDEYYCDHGTPNFETINKEFDSFCIEVYKNVLKKEDNMFNPTDGINKLCSTLIHKKDLNTNIKIISCKKNNNKWQLRDDSFNVYDNFDFLYLTIPAPQILELDIDLENNIKTKLQKVNYQSYATLILYSDKNFQIDDNVLNSSYFKKVINNSSKYNYKNFYSYVFHSHDDFVESKNSYDKEELCLDMYDYIKKNNSFDLCENVESIKHLWKYAIVKNNINEEYIYDKNNNIAFCGDYFKYNNLEGSFFSTKSLLEKSKRVY